MDERKQSLARTFDAAADHYLIGPAFSWQLHVKVGDFEPTGWESSSYDVVLCSLGIFFASDIPKALAELWRLVAPGGRLTISTWEGEGLGEVYECFGAAVRDVWPDVPTPAAMPWSSIATPTRLVDVFASADLPTPTVVPFRLSEELDDERMWASFMGGGIRGLLERFSPAELAAIRAGVLARLAERRISSIDYVILLAVATRT